MRCPRQLPSRERCHTSRLHRVRQDQFDFFAKAVPYLQAATDEELTIAVSSYSDLLRQHELSSPSQLHAHAFAIELVWRTHLLMPLAYAEDCRAICGGGPIDHSILPVTVYPNVTIASSIIPGAPQPLAHLVGAMRRQQSFMEKILARRGEFDTEVGLQHAMEQYGRFLGLMKWHPGTMLVPTLAIDLLWHTHQMFPTRYAKETIALAGRFINHDDNMEEDKLSKDLAQTEAMWEQAYGVRYLAPDDAASQTPKAMRDRAALGAAVLLLASCAFLGSPLDQGSSAADTFLAESSRRQMQSGDCSVADYHISSFVNEYHVQAMSGNAATSVQTTIECKLRKTPRVLHLSMLNTSVACPRRCPRCQLQKDWWIQVIQGGYGIHILQGLPRWQQYCADMLICPLGAQWLLHD